MEIYLVRHTQPANVKGMCYGQANIALNEPYLDDFNKIALAISYENAVVYSSPLDRCSKLANFLSTDNQPILDDRLKELNFGDWEKKLWNSLNQDEVNKWMNDFVNIAPPHGETFNEMYVRINDFIKNVLLNQQIESPIIIITHAGVIRCFVAYVLNVPLTNAFKIPVDYGSITKINLNVDDCYNQLGYLNKICGN